MPRINLLPVRAARKVDSARTELLVMGGVLLAVFAGQYYWYASIESELEELEQRTSEIRADIRRLELAAVKVKDFKSKATVLEQKLGVIDVLKKQKTGPTKMLDDLSQIMTRLRRVWLTDMDSKQSEITFKGGAMGHEDISSFTLALQNETPFFKNVRLTSVTSKRDKNTSYLVWELKCTADYSAG